MNILPKLLFLFQCVPIKLGKDFFENLNRITSKFIWQGRKPRIKLKLLQDAKERGGLGLPNWEKYYQAAISVWIKDWIHLRNRRLLALEGHDMQIGWHAIMWDGKYKAHQYFQNHHIRWALLDVWIKIKKNNYIEIPNWLSILEIFMHPKFINLGRVITYKDILDENGDLKTRKRLSEDGIELEWWAYLQIQSRYRKDKKEPGIKLEYTQLDKILLGTEDQMIKKIYQYLLEQDLLEEQVKETMLIWSKNFGYSIDLDNWQSLWDRNRRLTLATSYKENLYKMFYRWHLPPTRLEKIDKKTSPTCWKCRRLPGTYYHMWWECSKAQNFWNWIKNWLEEILLQKIDLKPEIFLLGIINDKLSKASFYLLLHILTAARLAYAQKWKGKETPTEEEIINKILSCAEMDRLTLEIKNKTETEYYEIWKNLYDWLEIRKIAEMIID